MSSDALMARLNLWACKEAKIDPDNFSCAFYSCCNKSTGMALKEGKTCAMSYVGRRYAKAADETIPRLVIVGIDHGRHTGGGTTYEGNRTYTETHYMHDGEFFNPHYVGVVRTAAAFLGKVGSHCAKTCQKKCKRSIEPLIDTCVLDRFVQPNLVKCAPITQTSMTSTTTEVMRGKCSSHLINEIRLLEPNIIIFHGVRSKWAMLSELRHQNLRHVPVGPNSEHREVLYWTADLNCHLIFLRHPSRGWLHRTWDRDAVPSLEHLKGLGIVPIN